MKSIKRRGFLKMTAGLLSALPAAADDSKGAAVQRRPVFSAFDTVSLGGTGIKTSRLCFGTGYKAFNRVSEQTRLGHANLVALLRAGYDRGIRCFDSADLYGTHGHLAEALKPFPRDSYTLISKIWWRKGGVPEEDKSDVTSQVERYLKELATGHLDIVQLHCLESGAWVTEMAEMMAALEACKQAGKIRAHGVSIHGLAALQASPKVPWLDVAHVRVNPFGVKMHGTVEDNMRVIEELHRQGKGVVGMKILGEGTFAQDSDKVNESLAFALKSGCVDVLNIAFMNTEQIDDIALRISKV